MRKLMVIILALGLSWMPASAQEYNLAEAENYGVIQELRPSLNDILIHGLDYNVSLTAEVEIGGTYGAYTLLQPGMRVFFRYHQHDDGRRVIFYLRELGSGESMEDV